MVRTAALFGGLCCMLLMGCIAGCGEDPAEPAPISQEPVDPYLLDVWRSGAPSEILDSIYNQATRAQWVLSDWAQDGSAHWIYDAEAMSWRNADGDGIGRSAGFYRLASGSWACLYKYNHQYDIRFTRAGSPVQYWAVADEATLTMKINRWVEIQDSSYDGEDPPSNVSSVGVYVVNLDQGLVISSMGSGSSEGSMVKDVAGKDELLRLSGDWTLELDLSSLRCPGRELTASFQVHGPEGEALDTWTGAQSIDPGQEEYQGRFASDLSRTSFQFDGLRNCTSR